MSKTHSFNATVTKIPVRSISEKRIETKLLHQKWGLKDSNSPAVEEFKQSRFYSVRLWLNKNTFYLLTIMFLIFTLLAYAR